MEVEAVSWFNFISDLLIIQNAWNMPDDIYLLNKCISEHADLSYLRMKEW